MYNRKQTVGKRPHSCHYVPIIFLSGEFENPRILRVFANGAPDMKVMGTVIIGKFGFPYPYNGSFAPPFRT